MPAFLTAVLFLLFLGFGVLAYGSFILAETTPQLVVTAIMVLCAVVALVGGVICAVVLDLRSRLESALKAKSEPLKSHQTPPLPSAHL